MRRFLLFIFSFSLFFIFSQSAYADFLITPIREKPTQPSSISLDNINEWSDSVNENTATVQIDFSKLPTLPNNNEYQACLKADPRDCSGGHDLKELPFGQPSSDHSSKVYVCADGDQDLKFASDTNKTECADDDFFHAQSIYTVSLFNKDVPTAPIETATFYVYFYYPEIQIEPASDGIKPGDQIKVNIYGTRRPHDKEDRNNYEIDFEDSNGDTLDYYCVNVHEKDYKDNKDNEVGFHKNDSGTNSDTVIFSAGEGDYTINIFDQEHEKKSFFNRSTSVSFQRTQCTGGYKYYTATIKIRKDGTCGPVPHGNTPRLLCIPLQEDPNGQDIAAGFGKAALVPLPPCSETKVDNPGKCPTGLGIDIQTDAAGFVQSVFGLILSLSGGLALLLIIYSGYQLISSQGTPEKLDAARQQLTSAIIGLLFIIFALVILQFIGVDILQLDKIIGGGFGK